MGSFAEEQRNSAMIPDETHNNSKFKIKKSGFYKDFRVWICLVNFGGLILSLELINGALKKIKDLIVKPLP
jgi:hypothetical protein